MKLRFSIIFCFLIATTINTFAQQLEIKSFTPIPLDLSASTESRQDYNGNFCALLKIVAPNIDFTVQGNVIGKIERKGEETWCYLSTGTKNIKIVPTGFEPILMSFENWGIPSLVSQKTYNLVLNAPPLGMANLTKVYKDIKLRNFRASDFRPESEIWMAIACELNGKQIYYSHAVWMSMSETDKDKHKILGVLLPTPNNFFIVSCRDEGSHMYLWDEAKASFGERLPSEDECNIIAHSTIPLCDNCVTLDKAMIDYGGEPLVGCYWGWEDAAKSQYNIERNEAVCMFIERDDHGTVQDADNGWRDKNKPSKVRLVIKPQ